MTTLLDWLVVRIPYLQRLLSTNVGTATAGRRVVELPSGCTSTACRSLVLKASVDCDEHVRASLVSSSLDETLVLMQTADFLCLTELVAELTVWCAGFMFDRKMTSRGCPAGLLA